LLIEAGSNNRDDPTVVRPGLFMQHQALQAARIKTYLSPPSAALAGRAAALPVGHGLGGGSSVNFQMYTRASASDYDDWDTPGWSAKELLPLLRKLENCTYTQGDTHGKDGPIGVSFGGFREETIMTDCEAAVRALGYEIVEDANDLKTGNAFQVFMSRERFWQREGKKRGGEGG
jgi:alcohol oxidase